MSSVKFSIDGDTNAEQVAGRAKAAVGSLDKQLDGIGNKFKTSFKDIFLSFLGPMALLGAAMSFIGKMIADNQKKQEDANQAAIDGTNALMSAEDRYYERKRNNDKKAKETVEQAKLTREEITQRFLQTDPRGQAIFEKALGLPEMKGQFAKPRIAALIPSVQAEVQALIAEDMKKNPAAAAAVKDSSFTGPQGFSNVIGVGANPVLENLTRQTDIQQQILEHLKATAPTSGLTDIDFTKTNPTLKVTA